MNVPNQVAEPFRSAGEFRGHVTESFDKVVIGSGEISDLVLPAIVQSRAMDETGYVQPTRPQLRAVRGTRSTYHNNGIQSWLVQENGEVKNVQVS